MCCVCLCSLDSLNEASSVILACYLSGVPLACDLFGVPLAYNLFAVALS